MLRYKRKIHLVMHQSEFIQFKLCSYKKWYLNKSKWYIFFQGPVASWFPQEHFPLSYFFANCSIYPNSLSNPLVIAQLPPFFTILPGDRV